MYKKMKMCPECNEFIETEEESTCWVEAYDMCIDCYNRRVEQEESDINWGCYWDY